MKLNSPNIIGTTAILLAAACATSTPVHAAFAVANSAATISANESAAHKGVIAAEGSRKHKRKAFLPACTAPSKSPMPCQRRR